MENTTPTANRIEGAASVDEAGRRRAGGPQAALLLAGSCMPILGSVLLAPVLPRVSAEFAEVAGASLLVPMILTAPALMMAVLAPFAGFLADRVGRKRGLIIAMLAYALFGTAPLWVDSLAGIVATRIGVGAAEAFIMTICTTMIMDYFDGKRRAKYLGMQAMLATLAATVFMAAGGALGSNDWRVPFWAYSIGLVLALLMAFLLWEPAESSTAGTRVPVPWRVIAVPVLVSLFGGILFYTLVVHLPYVVSELGLTDSSRIGLAAAAAAMATAVGSIAFRWLVHFGPAKLLPVAFALVAAGFIVVSFASSATTAVAGGMIAGLGTGLMLPTLLTWSVAGLEFHERGRGTGIWTAAFWSGQFLTPLVVVALAGLTGGIQSGIGLVGLAAVVAAIVALVFLWTTRGRTNDARNPGLPIQ